MFEKLLFRCSSLGHIMTPYATLTDNQLATIKELSAKDKKTDKQKETLAELIKKRDAPKELPEGVQTYLKKVYHQEVYGFTKSITSKYFEKGKYTEEEAIDMMQQTIYRNYPYPLLKNKERKSNEYLMGECDVIPYKSKKVWDAKNAYDWETFEKAHLTTLYDWQLLGYQILFDCTSGALFYCLNDMPEHLIQKEERAMLYSGEYSGFDDPEYLNDCEKLREMYRFSKFSIWERFKVFEGTPITDEIRNSIYTRIEDCRKWLNKYHEEKLALIESNKLIIE